MSSKTNRLAQYKKTGLSNQSRKAALKEEMREEAKSKRDEKIMGRRAFLEVENITSDSSEVKEQAKVTKQPKTPLVVRKKRELLQWKEKRDALKAEEKSKKRPPFVVGRSIRLGEDKTKSSEPCQHRKPSTATKPRPKITKSKVVKSAEIQKPKPQRKRTEAARNRQKKDESPPPEKVPSPPEKEPSPPAESDNDINTIEEETQGGQDSEVENNVVVTCDSDNNPVIDDSTDECITFTNNAWIPDNTIVPTPRVTEDMEQFKQKIFSPFVFTGSGPSGEDTTEDVDHEAMEVTEGQQAVTEEGNTSMETSYIEPVIPTRSDVSIEKINCSILHNHELTNSDNDRCHSEMGGASDECTVEGDGKPSEFAPFRKLYTDIVDKFTKLCEEWEEKEVKLQEQGMASQEVYDQIRTTVCQARLLMRSKLKQYIGLVDKAEDVDEPLPTKADDLQGFWDMMYIQIADIETKFKNLQVMEDSEWQDGVVEAKKRSATPKQRKKRRFSRGRKKTPSAKLKADRAKRAEQRLLLKQKMMAAKKQAQGGDPPNDTESPPTKSSLPSPGAEVFPPPPGSGLTPHVKVKQSDHTSSGTDSPVLGNLISITPGPSSVKKRRKSLRIAIRESLKGDNSSSVEESDSNRGGLVTKLVRIHTSKIMQEKLGSEVIMSPARRSLRIQRKSIGPSGLVGSSSSSESTDEHQLPSGNYVYKPNKSITDFVIPTP